MQRSGRRRSRPSRSSTVTGGGCDRLAAQLADRLLEQAAVGLEADRREVAGLLGAEQVAGAADLEVAWRRCGSPRRGRQNSWIAARRCRAVLGERALRRHEQVGEGEAVGAPDAAAQLVELGEAEAVGAVTIRIVFALGMSSPFSMIVVASRTSAARVEEGVHRLLELDARPSARGRRRCAPRAPARGAAWPSRRSTRPGCGRRTTWPPRAISGRIASRIDLAAERQDVGLDGQAVARRGLDDRDVAQAEQRRGSGCAGSASPTG